MDRTLTFWVTVTLPQGGSGNLCVMEEVSPAEYEQLLQCCRDGITIEEHPPLEALHQRIIDKAIAQSEEFDCEDEWDEDEELDSEDEWDEDEESAPFDYSELRYFVAIPDQIQQEA